VIVNPVSWTFKSHLSKAMKCDQMYKSDAYKFASVDVAMHQQKFLNII